MAEFVRDRQCARLVSNLEEIVKAYRSLLEVLRVEKQALIDADLEKIKEAMMQKEEFFYQLRELDSQRERLAKESALVVGADVENPRLLEIATKVDPIVAERLRNIHATLELLIKRITEINRDNETYARSALGNLTGAIEEIRTTLSGKSTYEKKGKMAYGPTKAGNIVSKEA